MIRNWPKNKVSKSSARGAACRHVRLLEELESRLLLSAVNFQPQVPYWIAGAAYGAVTGDFNGDGALDIAVANQGSNSVNILLNQGDGSFSAPGTYAAGTTPVAIATGDFNGDGFLDLAVANVGSSTVSILLGNGNGSFKAGATLTVGKTPIAIIAADLNGDNKMDLAVANKGDNTISVLLGNGDGSFQPAVAYAAGSGPIALVAGDFRHTGVPDLAVANFDTASVSLLNNDGAGKFAAPVSYAVGSFPRAIVAADFNRDGRLDLAVANSGDATVSVLLNTATGLAPAVAYTAGLEPFGIAAADVTGDGATDLIITNFGASTVSVFSGNGDGTFAAKLDFATGPAPTFVIAAPLTASVAVQAGTYDLIVGNTGEGTLGVLLNGHTTVGAVGVLRAATFTPYVQSLYQDLLQRAADPAGLAYFVGQLQQGTPALQVVGAIVGSQEYQQDVVQALYQKLLGRAADPGGLAAFTALLAAGGTDEQVAAVIYGSPEFYTLAGATNAGFISALYTDALQRSADPAGAAALAAQLAAGSTRQQVAALMLQSTEYRQLTVQDLFASLLGYAPSLAEQALYTQQLAGGISTEALIVTLATTPAYYPRPSATGGTTYTDAAYLTQIYQDFLGRPIDPVGLQAFSAMLDAQPGTAGQQAVVLAIESSTEYRTDLVQTYYQQYLHRAATATEAAAGVSLLAGGTTDQAFIATLVGTPEYSTLHGGTTNGFLFAAFNDLLGAAVSPWSRQFATYQYNMTTYSTPAATEALDIITGSVNVNNVTISTGFWGTMLDALYQRLLRRNVDPNGQAVFTTLLQAGTTLEQVAADIASTPEYIQRSLV